MPSTQWPEVETTCSSASAKPESKVQPRPRIRFFLESTAVFAASACTFLLLRSHNITAVDGAVRVFEVFRNPRLSFHGSNHMLYPVYVLGWTRLAGLLGFSLTDPKDFIRAIQTMNACFAAGCCAVLFAWVRALTGSLRLALSAALLWALSHAVLLHASNAAEPLAGVFISVCAFSVALLSVRSNHSALMIPAGFLIALAMASYQSMVFIGLACGLLALLWPAQASARIARALVLSFSFVAGLAFIYGISYWLQGIRTFAAAKSAFFEVRAGEAYGGFHLAKILNLPVGLTNAVVIAIPHEYEGLRWLLKHPQGWLLRAVVSVAVIAAAALWALLRKTSPASPAWLRTFLIACCGALTLDLLLLIFWDPLYDKLWLQPLWLLLLALFTRAGFADAGSKATQRTLAAAMVMVATINLSSAIRSARGPWPNFDEASRVNVILRPVDYTITEWNSVALLYREVWAGETRAFDFPANTCARSSAGLREMEAGIAVARARGGQIYFLGALDLDKPVWDTFLGSRCGVPYNALSFYRDQARTVATFQSDGRMITLRRLEP